MAEAATRPFEMFDIFKPTADLLSHLLFEEFIMLVLAVVPLFLGLVAALHVMTGITKGPLDAEESENVSTETAALLVPDSRPRTAAPCTGGRGWPILVRVLPAQQSVHTQACRLSGLACACACASALNCAAPACLACILPVARRSWPTSSDTSTPTSSKARPPSVAT